MKDVLPPLAERGPDVHRIDLSEAMVAGLRAKPGAERVGATVGDFAGTRVECTFSLVHLVINTISNLRTQDAQVACFATAAAHLAPGGRFVVEVGVRDLQGLRVERWSMPFRRKHVAVWSK